MAIVTTHPVQYNAPLFALLAKEPLLEVKVFYTWSQVQQGNKFDPGFGKVIEWDIPLLDGYDYSFVQNRSTSPGTHHFKGIVNPTLNSEIESWKPTAVLVYGWAFSSHLKCIRHFHKKKTVLFRGDSTLLDETKGIKTLLRRIFLRWVYNHINYALYVGTNNKKYFATHGLKQDQLLYAPHAIDNNRFADKTGAYAAEAREMRKRFGFTDEDVVILFAGKFEKKKDPFFIVNLLKKIQHTKLKALFVGNGDLEVGLKNEAANDNRIVFLGFQNQKLMPVICRVADIFMLPSIGPGETWGLALNEAMACGRAVAANEKAGGAVDLIDNGVNGLIFTNSNSTEIEKLIEKALADKSVLIEMGKQSQDKIHQFSFERIVKPIVSLAENFRTRALL